MRQPRHIRITMALCAALVLAACGASPTSSINRLLDARDTAISKRDIAAYAGLIADDYHAHQQDKAEIVSRMKQLFTQFRQLKMESFGRDIFVIDDTHARATQSYRLKVLMDASWREMLQREELSLTRSDKGWKISGGL